MPSSTNSTMRPSRTRTVRKQPAPAIAFSAASLVIPRPTHVGGVAVTGEEPVANLPGKPFRISKLFLADGSTAFACRDCPYTDDSRGKIMTHRNAAHGARIGTKRPSKNDAPDPVLPPREDGTAVPHRPMDMTIGEIVAIAPSLMALGDLLDKLESERDEARRELKQLRVQVRENAQKAASFDTLQEEVIELRVHMANTANFEKIREEWNALKQWKRKMITRLKSLGFQLTEEDQ